MTRCRPIRQDRTPARRRARDGVPLPPSCRPARPTPRRERGDRRAAPLPVPPAGRMQVDRIWRAGGPACEMRRADVTWSVREAARSRSAAATNSDSGSRSPARTSVATGPDGRRAPSAATRIHRRETMWIVTRCGVACTTERLQALLVRASRSKTGQPGPQPDIARRGTCVGRSPICSTASGMDRDARSSSSCLASSARSARGWRAFRGPLSLDDARAEGFGVRRMLAPWPPTPRGTGTPGDVPWVVPVAVALPLLGLGLLLARPELDLEWEHHPSHFWLVLSTAAVSVALARTSRQGGIRTPASSSSRSCSCPPRASSAFTRSQHRASCSISPNAGFSIATPVGLVLASVFAAASTNSSRVRADRSSCAHVRRSSPDSSG